MGIEPGWVLAGPGDAMQLEGYSLDVLPGASRWFIQSVRENLFPTTFPADQAWIGIAQAAVAHQLSLLEEFLDVFDKGGLPLSLAALARSHLDATMVALYAHFGQAEALEKLYTSNVVFVSRIRGQKVEGQTIQGRALASETFRFLERRADPNEIRLAALVKDMENKLYSLESHYGAHATLEVLVRYLEPNEDANAARVTVNNRNWDPVPPYMRMGWMIELTHETVGAVFKEDPNLAMPMNSPGNMDNIIAVAHAEVERRAPEWRPGWAPEDDDGTKDV